jgi:hypothetical protein
LCVCVCVFFLAHLCFCFCRFCFCSPFAAEERDSLDLCVHSLPILSIFCLCVCVFFFSFLSQVFHLTHSSSLALSVLLLSILYCYRSCGDGGLLSLF